MPTSLIFRSPTKKRFCKRSAKIPVWCKKPCSPICRTRSRKGICFLKTTIIIFSSKSGGSRAVSSGELRGNLCDGSGAGKVCHVSCGGGQRSRVYPRRSGPGVLSVVLRKTPSRNLYGKRRPKRNFAESLRHRGGQRRGQPGQSRPNRLVGRRTDDRHDMTARTENAEQKIAPVDYQSPIIRQNRQLPVGFL